jgi:hypothetical protein
MLRFLSKCSAVILSASYPSHLKLELIQEDNAIKGKIAEGKVASPYFDSYSDNMWPRNFDCFPEELKKALKGRAKWKHDNVPSMRPDILYHKGCYGVISAILWLACATHVHPCLLRCPAYLIHVPALSVLSPGAFPGTYTM